MWVCQRCTCRARYYFMVRGVTLVLTFMHIIKRLAGLNALVTSVLLIRVSPAKAVKQTRSTGQNTDTVIVTRVCVGFGSLYAMCFSRLMKRNRMGVFFAPPPVFLKGSRRSAFIYDPHYSLKSPGTVGERAPSMNLRTASAQSQSFAM